MDNNERILVGTQWGKFNDLRTGQEKAYCSVFLLEAFPGKLSPDRHFEGQKAAKYACASPDLFLNIPIGSSVVAYFDQRGTIVYLAPAAGK